MIVLNASSASNHIAKFLVDVSIQKKILQQTTPVSSSSIDNKNDCATEYFELDKVFIGKPIEKYYLIPYNLSKLTFFIFIRVKEDFKLDLLKQIDDVLASHMLLFSQEIAEQQIRRNLIR